ncbi:MAG: hypothetical protein QNK37_17210 [Acidobacteriota bacterium]|nr:hypothetical protein [Acidobacteriota bacterium]
MLRVILPRNDKDRAQFLKRAVINGEFDLAAGKRWLTPGLHNQLKAVRADFTPKFEVLLETFAARQDAVEEKDAKAVELSLCVRHLYSELEFMYARKLITLEQLKRFRLPTDGPRAPKIQRPDDWIGVAERMLVQLGKLGTPEAPFVSSPTVEALTECLREAEDAMQQLDRIKAALKDARIDMDPLRDDVYRVHADVFSYMNHSMRWLERSRKRDIMRRYGFAFESLGPNGQTTTDGGSNGNPGDNSGDPVDTGEPGTGDPVDGGDPGTGDPVDGGDPGTTTDPTGSGEPATDPGAGTDPTGTTDPGAGTETARVSALTYATNR